MSALHVFLISQSRQQKLIFFPYLHRLPCRFTSRISRPQKPHTTGKGAVTHPLQRERQDHLPQPHTSRKGTVSQRGQALVQLHLGQRHTAFKRAASRMISTVLGTVMPVMGVCSGEGASFLSILRQCLPYRAESPSSSSMRSRRLYFATRSLRQGAPVLIYMAFIPTAISESVGSSVSPERWEGIKP